MDEKIIFELAIAIVIITIILKLFLKPKKSNRGIINYVELKNEKSITNDNIYEKIRELIEKGHKIEAIKLVRQITGMGLKEAKDYVDLIEKGQNPPVEINEVQTIKLEESVKREIINLLIEGKKIEAIKLVRLKSNLGLKEAKDYIDSLK